MQHAVYLCLVLLQDTKCFVPVQIFFSASPKIWLHLVPLQNLLCRHKNQFYRMQIIFLSATKCLWQPQYVNKFLVWHKKFGPGQNILGPVKGQGIRYRLRYPILTNKYFFQFWNLILPVSINKWTYLQKIKCTSFRYMLITG